MSLFDLPPEILAMIMDYAGAEFFQEDVRRLAVCKTWEAYAKTTLYRQPLFTPSIFLRFCMLSHEHPSCSMLFQNLRVLEIRLQSSTIRHYPLTFGDLGIAIFNSFTWEPAIRASGLVDVFRAYMAYTGYMRRVKSPFLRNLPLPGWGRLYEQYAHFPIMDLLCFSNLKELKFDMPICNARPPFHPDEERFLPSGVRKLLSRLIRLEMCLPDMCPCLLANIAEEVNPQLQELVVTVPPIDHRGTDMWLDRSCRDGQEFIENYMIKEMKTQIIRIANLLDAPKKVMLHYKWEGETYFDMPKSFTFDVLANKDLELDGNSPYWKGSGSLMVAFDMKSVLEDLFGKRKVRSDDDSMLPDQSSEETQELSDKLTLDEIYDTLFA